jgi:uncharacterized membrane protein YdjX (TVP38/TMEM64 family)
MDAATTVRSSAPSQRRGLGRAGPVAVVATAAPILGACATIVAGPFVARWLHGQGTAGLVYFTVGLTALAALTLTPTYATAVIAGWTFGFRAGATAAMIGAVGGATFCYLGARWLVGTRVAETFREHPRWDVVRRSLAEENALKTLWIVFLLRLSPVLPFGTTNVLLATTGVPLAIFVVGTLAGLAPRIGLVALAAAGAEQFDLASEQSWLMFAAGIGATMLCIVVLAVAGKHALERATREQTKVTRG